MHIEAHHILADAIRPVFENVESRTLMSASSLNGHVLTIVGTSGDDQIDVDISDDGSQLWTSINGHTSDAMAGQGVYEIRIDAGNGDDVVHVDSRISANCYVTTGGGHDVVHTGRGNDVIGTGGGNDTVDSGAGHDRVDAGSGKDKVNGGSGNDYLVGGSGTDSISADGGVDRLFGRRGDDKLYGDVDDAIDGEGGVDHVSRSSSMKIRNDGFVAPKIVSLTIVDADTGRAVAGYERLAADTTLDPTKLPARYTIVANAEDGVESVYFQSGDHTLFHRDNGKAFSLTSQDATTGKFAAWRPTAGRAYVLNVVPNTADDLRGFGGETFTVKLTLKGSAGHAATGAGLDADAPVIRVEAIDANAIVGQAFALDATGTTVPNFQIEDARFAWNFGDPAGKHNAMPGFNAAHVYDRTGTYTATLTVTAPGGEVSTYRRNVTVAARAMRTIYVAANGNDANEGGSQDRAVRTLGRAAQLVTDDTRVLLRRGDRFGLTAGFRVENSNVAIATYGVGAGPVVRYEGARKIVNMFRVEAGATHVSITGLTFDSIYDDDTDGANMPQAVSLAGTLVTVRGNTFLNVGYAVNGNGQPTGVLVSDNAAPSTTGVRNYFAWVEGTQWTIVGNTVANVTREHVIRVGGGTKVTIAHNDFTNLDRRAQGDAIDYMKGAINQQKGAYSYIAYNNVDGPLSVGPLGNADGLAHPETRFAHGVVEGNVVSGNQIIVQHGTANLTIRDNVVNTPAGITAIYVTGWNVAYGRGIADLVIDHNLGVNHTQSGRFLEVAGPVSGMALTRNTYVAPNLVAGAYASGAIYTHESSLSSFATIDGNVWPTLDDGKSNYVGRVAIVGDMNDLDSYLGGAAWNALPKVGTDRVENVAATATVAAATAKLKAA